MRRVVVRGVLFVLLAVFPAIAFAADHGIAHNGAPVRVMTQNLYVGADILRILQAQTPEQIPFVVAAILQTVRDTDFRERAGRISAEIEHARPDVIGLQEAVLLTVISPTEPPAVEESDYLEILMDALKGRGLDYVLAGVVVNSDTQLPVATPDGLGLVRYVDRDAVLVRADVAVSDLVTGNYQAKLEFPIGDPPVATVEFLRGYVTLAARVGRQQFRFVTTHFELPGADLDPMMPFIQAQQAQELIGILSEESLPVVVTGDFNSSPDDPVVPPLIPPYWQFVDAGYADLWELGPGPASPGYTCCQAEDLLNPLSMLTQRIDHILVKNDPTETGVSLVGSVRIVDVGADPADRTASGLWPSDHAGVSAQVHVPALNGRPPAELRLRR